MEEDEEVESENVKPAVNTNSFSFGVDPNSKSAASFSFHQNSSLIQSQGNKFSFGFPGSA